MHKEYFRVNLFKETERCWQGAAIPYPARVDRCVFDLPKRMERRLVPPLGEQLADSEHQIAWREGLFDNWKRLILVHWHALPGSGNE